PERPPVSRVNTASARASSSVRSSSSRTPTYYASPTDNAPPRLSREASRGVPQPPSSPAGLFGEVKYAQAYRQEDVAYGDYYRPGQPTPDYYSQSRRGEAAAAYA
ncbi:hypothetical protein V494_05955, partial [Pseudogymnoascus sp. VKM F-4513 (FW-928)]